MRRMAMQSKPRPKRTMNAIIKFMIVGVIGTSLFESSLRRRRDGITGIMI